MAFTKQEISRLYSKRAKRYDVTANLYRLTGFRLQAARKRAVEALGLQRGDTVVEISCGTGLNFPLLERAVGSDGRIIGVDLTSEMLDVARERVARNGWSNVELVQSDAAQYEFPRGIGGIISTFAITLVPEYDQVIKNGAGALASGKRLVILDIRAPDGAPAWLTRAFVALTKPFGVTLDLEERRPWESVDRHLVNASVRPFYFGIGYITVGEAS